MSDKRGRRRRRLVLVIAAAAALAFAAYAFTAANIVPPSNAGDGAGVISGYTVSNIAYQLEAGNPANIDRVSFDLNLAAGTVYASVVTPGGSFSNLCTGGPILAWSCDFAVNPTVLSANSFRVVAVQ